MKRARLVWVILGPVVFPLAWWLGSVFGLDRSASAVSGLACWMGVWWVSEAVPLAVTSLLPLVLLPASGVLTPSEAAAPYADHIIFLFLGGFMVASAVEASGLHRRIALNLVAWTGRSPALTILGFMLAGAVLSMWISNSATAVMMLPIALALTQQVRQREGADEASSRRFEKALLLGIAYSTSIGGVGTLIGTPPNIVLAAAIERIFHRTLDFAQWLAVGIPLVVVLLPLAWLYLTRVAFRFDRSSSIDARAMVRDELSRLGGLTRKEAVVLAVFIATALAWIFRSTKHIGSVTVPGLDQLLPDIKDSTIAVAAAVLLFALPGGRLSARPILDWRVGKTLPWGVILLFGGGLSLALAFKESGLAEALARGMAAGGGLSALATVALVVGGTVALTEFTSNTATSSMLMPLLAAAAVAAGLHPVGLMVAGAVACSFAFCLPVATPPNAIVYGSGKLSMRDMVLAGVAMNLMAYLIWLLLFFVVAAPILGIDPETVPDWALGLEGP